MTASGNTVLAIACTRGHIGLIDYLLKEKHCDPDGEITVIYTDIVKPQKSESSNRLYFCCFTNSDPVNSKGESLKSLAESLGLSDVITYLETFSADSAGGILILHIRVLALEFLVLSVNILYFFSPSFCIRNSFNECTRIVLALLRMHGLLFLKH